MTTKPPNESYPVLIQDQSFLHVVVGHELFVIVIIHIIAFSGRLLSRLGIVDRLAARAAAADDVLG